MADETTLLNAALSKIGASVITGIDDGTVNANHCKRIYPELRDSLLRSHHWKFARKRVELVVDAAAPAFEFAYSYTLPSDCLKVIEYNGANVSSDTTLLYGVQVIYNFQVEGNKLLTNDGTVKIVYIRRVTDPGQMDALFYQLLATWLAGELASAITKDVNISTKLLKQATEILLPQAVAVSGQEGSVPVFVVDDLTWGR